MFQSGVKMHFGKFPDTWLFSQWDPPSVNIGPTTIHGKCLAKIHLQKRYKWGSCSGL